MHPEKVIIFSAPSGSGKSTLINYLLDRGLELEFSISATSRPPRGTEQHGKEYYFFSAEEFRKGIEEDRFLEWQEVYEGVYYGTLKSEMERIRSLGRVAVFDVDVIGGLNIKKILGHQALAIFIKPPSVEILRQRLQKRGADSPDKIEQRIAKAEFELGFAQQFDVIITNDRLEEACRETENTIRNFLRA